MPTDTEIRRNDSTRAVWSDDESDDLRQKSKDVSRKRAGPIGRRSRTAAYDGFVGKRRKTENVEAKRAKKSRHWDEETDEDQLMEHTLPDYLQHRRAKFEARTKKMKEMGLRLPPSYDDIEFSDDERLADLVEKPDFEHGKPAGPYKDRQLPKSLGLIPAPIAQWLRDYQIEGTAFLHALFVYQTGGILGDDMG